MPNQTNEQALEAVIEKCLTEICFAAIRIRKTKSIQSDSDQQCGEVEDKNWQYI